MSDYKKSFTNLDKFIPADLRNTMNTSLMTNLFNRMLSYEESQSFYGVIGDKTTSNSENKPNLEEENADRFFNSLAPVSYYKIGNEEEIFTFKDFLNKASACGIDTSEFSTWGEVPNFNFAPPISLDKFINFSQYVWVQSTIPQQNYSWNLNSLPEYYVIEKPKNNNTIKMPVDVATTGPISLNGTLKPHEIWTLVFTSSTTFSITSAISGTAYFGTMDSDLSTISFPEFSVTLKQGGIQFVSGDQFIFEFFPLTSKPSIISYAGIGTGSMISAQSLLPYGSIDGFTIGEGMRVLVKDQPNPLENGIYLVSAETWVRTPDDQWSEQEVFSKHDDQLFVMLNGIVTVIGTQNNVSPWTMSNYWVHKDDLTDREKTFNLVSATRPIIEYDFDLKLAEVVQTKSKFNAVPLFGIFDFNGQSIMVGTKQLSSPLFYYAEDFNSPIDTVLNRRVVTENFNFTFEHNSLYNGRMIFFKHGTILSHFWKKGLSDFSVTKFLKNTNSDGDITIFSVPHVHEEITITFLTPTTFSVIGSRTGSYGDGDTTNPYASNGLEFAFLNVPTIPFSSLDTFKFFIDGPFKPEYVIRNSNDLPELFGQHPSQDLSDVGTWLTPKQMTNNLEFETRSKIKFGDLVKHFGSIISEQNVEGSIFGANNFRNINPILGLGGNINLIDNQFNLLFGLLSQTSSSPISLIDFAEQQYETSLNSIHEFLQKHFGEVLTLAETADIFAEFLKQFIEFYSNKPDTKNVFNSSLQPIPNWPLTLPMMGVVTPELPKVIFNKAMNANVLLHHDGHQSPIMMRNIVFEQEISSIPVKRYDGNVTSGTYQATAPQFPYKGQLWFDKTNNVLKSFVVDFEGPTSPINPVPGQFWYNRDTNTLKQFMVADWYTVSNDRWLETSYHEIYNNLVFQIETLLYQHSVLISGINIGATNPVWDTSSSISYIPGMKFEFGKFAIASGLDPYGSTYNAQDAFSWNYSDTTVLQSVFGLSTGVAQWHSIYDQYLGTSRPDLEPWKILGLASKNDMPGGWAQYESSLTYDELLYDVSYDINVLFDTNQNVSGTFAYPNGTTLLLVNQTDSLENGVYVVSPLQTISRIPSFTTFNVNDQFKISSGNMENSIWVVIDALAITFQQARNFNPTLWTYILANTTKKICVNIFTDELLPPYVAVSEPAAANAMITDFSQIQSPSKSYNFGDLGPTELLWTTTINYQYSLLRNSLKRDPINCLSTIWGFQTFEVDGLKLDRITGKVLSHKEFSLNGEFRNTVSQAPTVAFTNASIANDLTVKFIVGNIIDNQPVFVNVENNISFSINSPWLITIDSNSFYVVVTEQSIPLIIGDVIEIKMLALNNAVTSTFIPTTKYIYNGLNQIYVNLQNYNGNSISNSKDDFALRKWETKLAYRSNRILETENLKVFKEYDSSKISGYSILLKVNHSAKNSWIHALRIQVTKIGSSLQKVPNVYIPTNQGVDWEFRIENYFSRYPQLEKFTTSNTGSYITFNSLTSENSSDEWKLFTEITGKEIVQLPVNIVGIQNVIDFINGYTMSIEADGWRVGYGDKPSFDEQTQRIDTWQLQMEKFIDELYQGTRLGQGIPLNPMMKNIWMLTPTGHVESFKNTNFINTNSGQFVYDIAGDVIQSTALLVVREDEQTLVSSGVPMFGGHVNIDEYEHVILFNDSELTETGLNVYSDNFLGISALKFLVSGKRQSSLVKRPSFGGFAINGNKTFKNLTAVASDIGNYYDADKVFENPLTTKHALSLFGYSKKQYFSDLGVADKSAFNFWRGMINAKGSNHAIDAFINSSKYESAKISEFWAYKVAEYGDARQKNFPEMKIETSDTILKHTRLFFANEPADVPSSAMTVINGDDEARWFSIEDINNNVYFQAAKHPIFYVTVTEPNQIIELPFKAEEIIIFDSIPYTTTSGEVVYNEQGPNAINEMIDQISALQSGTGNEVLMSELIDQIDTIMETGLESTHFTIINTSTVKFNTPGYYSVLGFTPMTPKFSPIKLFDYVEDQHVEDISIWHPAFGAHSEIAMDAIDIISPADNAIYNYSTKQSNNPNFDTLRNWGKKEIGLMWWDIKNLEYIPYYDKYIFKSFEERLARWGSLCEYSNINVYEWIKSDVPPSVYNSKATSEQGNSDIDVNIRKTGSSARKELYKRSRTWESRPIAWSYVPNPSEEHYVEMLTFGVDQLVLASTSKGITTALLENKTFDEFQIKTGMNFSAWLVNKPIGEGTFLSQTGVYLGTRDLMGAESLTLINPEPEFVADNTGTLVRNMAFEKFVITNNNSLRNPISIGEITFSKELIGGNQVITAYNPVNDLYHRIEIEDLVNATGNTPFSYNFESLGFTVTGFTPAILIDGPDVDTEGNPIQIASTENIPAAMIVEDFLAVVELKIRSYMAVEIISDFPAEILDNQLPTESPAVYSNELILSGFLNINTITCVLTSQQLVGDYTLSFEETTSGVFDIILNRDGIEVERLTGFSGNTALSQVLLFDLMTINVDFYNVTSAAEFVQELTSIASLIVIGFNGSEVSFVDYDHNIVLTQYGWRAWTNPTQKDLDVDFASPFSSWQPIYGEWVAIETTKTNLEKIDQPVLKTNNGDTIEKYKFAWGNWNELSDNIQHKSSDGSLISFTFDRPILNSHLTIYFNGIAQHNSNYVVNSKFPTVVSLTSLIAVGTKVTALLRKYDPTSTELNFDPSVAENVYFSTQYKYDYQYVIEPERDEKGIITKNTYYFWVQNKNTITNYNKKISCKQVATVLKNGPSVYLTFQEPRMFDAGGYSVPLYDLARYDMDSFFGFNMKYTGVTIANLNSFVTKNSTYKLRFTRDFTLRNDPSELDLKNVHTEWALIRPDSRTKIPSTLWDKVVDSACGKNSAGILVPSQRRISYDERHGTRTRYGFGADQVFADQEELKTSLLQAIVNPKTTKWVNSEYVPDFINNLDYQNSDQWFLTAETTRSILTHIGNVATAPQLNGIFFEILEDALANNYEFSDLFKTSRLAVQTIINNGN